MARIDSFVSEAKETAKGKQTFAPVRGIPVNIKLFFIFSFQHQDPKLFFNFDVIYNSSERLETKMSWAGVDSSLENSLDMTSAFQLHDKTLSLVKIWKEDFALECVLLGLIICCFIVTVIYCRGISRQVFLMKAVSVALACSVKIFEWAYTFNQLALLEQSQDGLTSNMIASEDTYTIDDMGKLLGTPIESLEDLMKLNVTSVMNNQPAKLGQADLLFQVMSGLRTFFYTHNQYLTTVATPFKGTLFKGISDLSTWSFLSRIISVFVKLIL